MSLINVKYVYCGNSYSYYKPYTRMNFDAKYNSSGSYIWHKFDPKHKGISRFHDGFPHSLVEFAHSIILAYRSAGLYISIRTVTPAQKRIRFK